MKGFEIGQGLTCDVDRLVASRLLVQANSGGGKTHTAPAARAEPRQVAAPDARD